jgi:hypothetical protein
MDEHRKNPYRRPAKPGEERPGVRQLPKDFDDLATGKTERLPRPRRAPAPLHDEREGAVIPGVRNMEARAVYDARVQAMRALVGEAEREAELHASLEDARRLRLWRARNVTDYRAFMESVVGVAPEAAERLAGLEPQHAAAGQNQDHVIALALRLEAALLAHARNASVRVAEAENGELRIGVELSASDLAHAVNALEDAGRSVSGIRRFLRDGTPGAMRDAGDEGPRGDRRDQPQRAERRERSDWGERRDQPQRAERSDWGERAQRDEPRRDRPFPQRGATGGRDAQAQFPRRDRGPFPKRDDRSRDDRSRDDRSRDDRGPRRFGKKPEGFVPKGRPRKPGPNR